jgi:hypothetical protein
LEYPEARADDILSISLVNAVEQCGQRFVAIFDEWDAPIREMPSVAQGLSRTIACPLQEQRYD